MISRTWISQTLDFLTDPKQPILAEVVGERTAGSMGLDRCSNQCVGRTKLGLNPGSLKDKHRKEAAEIVSGGGGRTKPWRTCV